MPCLWCEKASKDTMTLIVNQKNGPHGLLLIITDSNLLGKLFTQAKTQLDLTSQFYQGIEMSKEEVKKMMQKAQHIHITGHESLTLAIELSYVQTSNILYVQDIPHVQITTPN